MTWDAGSPLGALPNKIGMAVFPCFAYYADGQQDSVKKNKLVRQMATGRSRASKL